MINPLELAAAGLVVLGLGELAALIAVLFRHAIPHSPRVFHALLFFPMLLCSAACFAIAWVALTGAQRVAGLDALTLLVIFFVCEAVWIWILVAYAIWWWMQTSVDNDRTDRQDRQDERESPTDRGGS